MQGSAYLSTHLGAFDAEMISIQDPRLNAAMDLEIKYLLSLSPTRLLAGFYAAKGLEAPAERYSGWESKEIRGHTLGHYLTAMAQAYAATKDSRILNCLNETISGLEVCQRDDGYLGAFDDEHFDRVEKKIPVWVPWYTMHKLLAGLVSVASLLKNDKAQKIASCLGDWIAARVLSWSEEMRLRVLSVEYGGMNDCLYELYKLTKLERHLNAAHVFDEDALFTRITAGEDILKGLHANTTIPKFVGALNRFFVTGEEFYLHTCISFFDMVLRDHSYITGGNSEWEHFGEPGVLNARRSNCTCETCNTYNMLKLAAGLFMATGQRKYADFYERAFLNAILPSQNPKTGMTMYFQPMAAGYFKVYSEPYESFWCCTGTGMESFTKLGTHIYYSADDAVIINRYVSSSLNAGNLRLTVESGLPECGQISIRIHVAQGNPDRELRLRIPDWSAGPPAVALNGESLNVSEKGGYLYLRRTWRNGDTLTLHLPMQIQAHQLPDNPNAAAFRYGPTVLCAPLGNEDMSSAKTGVDVTIPSKNMPVKDFIIVREGNVEEWLSKPEENFVKGEGLVFSPRGTDSDDSLRFIPYFSQHEQRYGIYFTFVPPDSIEYRRHTLETAERERLERATVDRVPLGNDQYELEHQIDGVSTEAGVKDGLRFRKILKGGWFSLRVKLIPNAENILSLSFYSARRAGAVAIYADETLLAREAVRVTEPFGLYTQSLLIPVALCAKGEATLRFEAEGERDFQGLYDEIKIYSGI